VAFDYRIVALRRGYESVRLEDVTDRVNKMNATQPTAAPGERFTLPSPPPAPVLPTPTKTSGVAQLNAEK
jgi:hypothetical protein